MHMAKLPLNLLGRSDESSVEQIEERDFSKERIESTREVCKI